jgi:hypothetical protein
VKSSDIPCSCEQAHAAFPVLALFDREWPTRELMKYVLCKLKKKTLKGTSL